MAPLCHADDGKSPTFWTQERETKLLYIASFCTPSRYARRNLFSCFRFHFPYFGVKIAPLWATALTNPRRRAFRLINKLVRITLAVALLSFGTAVFAGTAPVPITNGGFESGNFLPGW